jgi:hypothetical protein
VRGVIRLRQQAVVTHRDLALNLHESSLIAIGMVQRPLLVCIGLFIAAMTTMGRPGGHV